MSGNKNNNRRPTEIAAGVVIGAGAVYGAYKLFQSMFGTEEPHQNQSLSRHQMTFLRDNNISVVNTIAQLDQELAKLQSYVFIRIFKTLFYNLPNTINFIK